MDERISFTSYQLQSGTWVPRVRVRRYLANEIKEQDFTWDEQFDSKKKADEFAERKAKEANANR